MGQTIVRRAYQATDVKAATRLLTDLAKRLEDEYPSAAGSVREGLEETLTVLTLQLSARLQRSLATTNAPMLRLGQTDEDRVSANLIERHIEQLALIMGHQLV